MSSADSKSARSEACKVAATRESKAREEVATGEVEVDHPHAHAPARRHRSGRREQASSCPPLPLPEQNVMMGPRLASSSGEYRHVRPESRRLREEVDDPRPCPFAPGMTTCSPSESTTRSMPARSALDLNDPEGAFA